MNGHHKTYKTFFRTYKVKIIRTVQFGSTHPQWWGLRQEDWESEVKLSCIARPCAHKQMIRTIE
jgi:hypothetical protein